MQPRKRLTLEELGANSQAKYLSRGCVSIRSLASSHQIRREPKQPDGTISPGSQQQVIKVDTRRLLLAVFLLKNTDLPAPLSPPAQRLSAGARNSSIRGGNHPNLVIDTSTKRLLLLHGNHGEAKVVDRQQ